MKTAASEFAARIAQARAVLKTIDGLLTQAESAAAERPSDWAYVGSMNHVVDSLIEIGMDIPVGPTKVPA